ncbi:MAG: 16S rRNA processing protein RimM [Bacteroidales bacterium]|nr:16S rRNA processing protein RimM [Bacteroidales bacterium]
MKPLQRKLVRQLRLRKNRQSDPGIRISDPMAYKADILLGRITKVHGREGIVTLRLENTFKDNLPDMEAVFLEIEGKPVPFFISESEYMGGHILRLKFEGYESVEKASEFAGCRVFLVSAYLAETPSEKEEDLSGYRILTPENKLIGTVTGIIRNPGQYHLNVDPGSGKDIMIPFHEDLIVEVDRKKKIIIMDLPEGLAEINL